MALPVITADQFTGWVKIVTNGFKEVDLNNYIETFREQYLRQILGNAAYFLIKKGRTRARWADLLDGTDYTNADGKNDYYYGLVNPLIYFIYFEFIRDNYTPTQTGKVKGRSENSGNATGAEVLNIARSRYNKAVGLINDSLPNFIEAYKELNTLVSVSVDNADDTYTLTITSTKYLEAGDTIIINGMEYTVDSIVENTTIVFNAGGTGLDFTGDLVTWKPFEEVDFCTLKASGI